MIDPMWSFHGMYPYPVQHIYDKFSMVDLEQPDIDTWEDFLRVQAEAIVLEAGDALFIPGYYWRHEQQLDQENVSIDLHLHRGRFSSLSMRALLVIYTVFLRCF